jgi:GntR family transcriptional regulator
MLREVVLKRFFIDNASSLPPYQQIKEQIKVAFATGQLKEGDLLPSIRSLAKQLGVAPAVVRRAYDELVNVGLLSTEHRKHVSVNRGLAATSAMEELISEAKLRCTHLLDWGHGRQLSSISLARLMVCLAGTREAASPSYAYVDAGLILASRIAEKIARVWEVNVLALSIEDAGRLTVEDLQRFSTILVNSYRFDALMERLKGNKERVFPVMVTQSDKMIRRVRRLPVDSSILLVHSNEDFNKIGKIAAERFQEIVDKRLRIVSKPVESIGDLTGLANTDEFKLVVVSSHVWDDLPEKAKKLPMVVRSDTEPDMESLEQIRISAGVFI